MASVLAKARRETARRELEFAAGMERISRRQDEEPPPGRPRVIVSPEAAHCAHICCGEGGPVPRA